MKRKNKDLAGTAFKIYERCLRGDWRPTASKIKKSYRLNDDQLRTVKKHVKRAAAVKGVMWGYHDAINAYRVCPNNAPGIAQAMLKYSQNHWADNGVNVNLMIVAAQKQGYISERSSENVQSSNEDASKEIRRGFDLLEFTHEAPSKNLETSSVAGVDTIADPLS